MVISTLRRAKHFAATRLLDQTFEYEGKRYRYFHHPYNRTSINERIVEVPIFVEIMKTTPDSETLEIGNVMAYYAPHSHTVVDKYEKAEGVINDDVVDYDPGRTFKLIISVSTMEHVGWDEKQRDPKKIPAGIARLRSLLAEGGRLYVTFPMGYYKDLDEILRSDGLPMDKRTCLKRVSDTNKWRQVEWDEIKNLDYGPYANGLVVAEFTPA